MVFTMHTKTKLFGEGINFYNKERSIAGSSGGEAALVSGKCVPFSIGGDLCGSIRGPAAFNGVFGYKPSPYRYPFKEGIYPVASG